MVKDILKDHIGFGGRDEKIELLRRKFQSDIQEVEDSLLAHSLSIHKTYFPEAEEDDLKNIANMLSQEEDGEITESDGNSFDIYNNDE